MENHVGDLWSIMQFLNPGLLGSLADFTRNYFQPIQADRDGAAAARLQKATGPFILRRLKTDRSIIDDLPDKRETKQYCKPDQGAGNALPGGVCVKRRPGWNPPRA